MNNVQQLAREIKRVRKELGLNGDHQEDLLKKVRDAFELSNDELAQALGLSLDTLLAYLAPETAKKRRTMPAADLLVLSKILAKGHR